MNDYGLFHLVPALRRGNAAKTLRRPTFGLVSGTPEHSNDVPAETIGTRQKTIESREKSMLFLSGNPIKFKSDV
jgi:hypothetical protein